MLSADQRWALTDIVKADPGGERCGALAYIAASCWCRTPLIQTFIDL